MDNLDNFEEVGQQAFNLLIGPFANATAKPGNWNLCSPLTRSYMVYCGYYCQEHGWA